MKEMNRNRRNRPSGDEGSVPGMPAIAVPAADSKSHFWDATVSLAQAGQDCIRVYRVYSAGDELADEAPSQAGPVRVDTVLYTDSRDRPRTALCLPSGEWTSRIGWGEPARRAKRAAG